jgi:23S rRNA U2552 (ribose-2'-O)-methylase RlmE/FtsJ
VQQQVGKTYVRKPKASRVRSREVFVVGKGFFGRPSDNSGADGRER